ncbi:MAG: hypothetical protein M3429_09835 [Verrucomicrobiota bacterium]|nr:hypothetical protein [Verrucomicrobiota bacterium]
MRALLSLLCLTIGTGSVCAQEQENKLVDRLLKPDMTLSNSAQNKQFNGTGKTPVEKKFEAKSFYSGNERPLKSFPGRKAFSAKGYETGKARRVENAVTTEGAPAYAKVKFLTGESQLVRSAAEGSRVAPTRDYAQSRPFLGEGTRQKILSQQDKPLTIDEIRELLNKGK